MPFTRTALPSNWNDTPAAGSVFVLSMAVKSPSKLIFLTSSREKLWLAPSLSNTFSIPSSENVILLTLSSENVAFLPVRSSVIFVCAPAAMQATRASDVIICLFIYVKVLMFIY